MSYLTIGFSTPTKFHIFPWIIKKVEKTEFSHVYFKIHSEYLNKNIIYQASGLEVNFMGEAIFYNLNKDLYTVTIPISEKQKLEFLRKSIDLLGKPYGIKQVLGMGLVRLANIIDYKVKNPWADGDHSYVCSELVASLLIDLGYAFEDLDNITPKDIYDKLENIHG